MLADHLDPKIFRVIYLIGKVMFFFFALVFIVSVSLAIAEWIKIS